jgi:hypothetical protein
MYNKNYQRYSFIDLLTPWLNTESGAPEQEIVDMNAIVIHSFSALPIAIIL